MNNPTNNKRALPHIVIATAYFYPKIGGVENYSYMLAKKLQESGEYTVSIITSDYDNTKNAKLIIDGMTVYRLPVGFRLSNTPMNLRWYWEIKKILKQEKPDILHVHSPVPYLPDMAAWAGKNVPMVFTYHSGSMKKGKWPIDALIQIYEKVFLAKMFQRARAVIAISQEFVKNTFPQYKNKTFFIPTGVDLGRFKKMPLPASQRVTYVGRIEHSSSWKGIDSLLQAMTIVVSQCPEATLELIGGGDALPHYKERAAQLGIAESVVFSGPKRGAELVEAYSRSNVVVLSSISDSEAFSVTLVEAMACGRPIVGTNIGGTPQLIDHEKNGLLVAPNKPEELAAAIIRVLNDTTLAQNLAASGAERSIGFSWDIQAKKYSDIFQSMLTKNI
ncbi:MAG: putative hexosyltransferase, glycosyltransferase family 1 [Candidatus Parcubacteria bacterium]|nr:putative hexosyltransferase, glycosyltransferase family 1 [Candidatus Parcubacteria bacterium]